MGLEWDLAKRGPLFVQAPRAIPCDTLHPGKIPFMYIPITRDAASGSGFGPASTLQPHICLRRIIARLGFMSRNCVYVRI